MATPIRPGPSPVASPRTPQRGISSTFSSPGGLRPEDEAVIFEIGARYFRAGHAGESAPKLVRGYGPQESRRVGDYREWLPGYDNRVLPVKKLEEWGQDHELLRLDLKDVDLGLFEDKIERSIRIAYADFLLLDAKSKKVFLVVPTTMPHQLLSVLLSLLFNNFQVPSIMLLPPPTTTVVAAGQRSGIVMDIGWHETTAAVIYELREVRQFKSTRAMKPLFNEACKLFQYSHKPRKPDTSNEDEKTNLDFYYVQELITRAIWCQTTGRSSLQGPSKATAQPEQNDTNISIPLPKSTDPPTKIPFSSLSKPVEIVLFANSEPPREQDEHEYPLQYLLYQALLYLPHDIRTVCMSRIMFTGGGANILGLKTRLLNELASIVKSRGWDPVWGKAAEEHRRRRREKAENSRPTKTVSGDTTDANLQAERAAFEEQLPDEFVDKIRQQDAKGVKPSVNGVIRGLETLGPWAGASLAAAQRDMSSVVEIDREIFLQSGLAGAKRESDLNPTKSRIQPPSLARLSMGDIGGWTLGAWGQ
ncbi:hypothetical protein MMC10_002132 [Thelotrema lepadinum]|nr:hypothetical protein [Thelotrema lepadinum]